MTTSVGFSGSQHGSAGSYGVRQYSKVRELLIAVYEAGAEFHYGMCYGWDDEAAEMSRKIGYRLIGHPPKNKKKIGTVKPDIELPAADYIVRDDRIIAASRFLIAAPFTRMETLRSGTFTVIRHTALAGVPGSIVWPNGTVSPIEKAPLLSRRMPDDTTI
jgi:hypothetical protein